MISLRSLFQGSFMKDCDALDGSKINLNPKKIALITRSYTYQETEKQRRGFADCFSAVLDYCDQHHCDTLCFSLYALPHRSKRAFEKHLLQTQNIRFAIVEMCDSNNTYIYHKTDDVWRVAQIQQAFGTLKGTTKNQVRAFVDSIQKQRIFGNIGILLCGETNAAVCRDHAFVEDTFGCRAALTGVHVILNPVHDFMRRHEMKKKRQFFSEQKRLVLSVWNKGKFTTQGRRTDSLHKPPWTVFYDGHELDVKPQHYDNDVLKKDGVEIGFVTVPDFK